MCGGKATNNLFSIEHGKPEAYRYVRWQSHQQSLLTLQNWVTKPAATFFKNLFTRIENRTSMTTLF